MTGEASEAEIGQMRSVIGSLGWIARQCHPEISYSVSSLQGVVSKAKVKDLKMTNTVLREAQELSKLELICRSDAVSWNDAVMVTVSDASFAQEIEIDDSGAEKPHRTQKAFISLLVDPTRCENDSAGCHIIAWRSLTDKRVCRATLQAEAHGMLSGTETGDRLVATIVDCKGLMPTIKEWEKASCENLKHLWLSDCESLVSHLKNPRTEKLENVRLSIDIQSLKQVLWENSDGTSLDELLPAKAAENAVRWIDTSCMVCDCLTKRMKPTVLLDLMDSGRLSLVPTVESQMQKLRKQKQRREHTKTYLKETLGQTET